MSRLVWNDEFWGWRWLTEWVHNPQVRGLGVPELWGRVSECPAFSDDGGVPEVEVGSPGDVVDVRSEGMSAVEALNMRGGEN